MIKQIHTHCLSFPHPLSLPFYLSRLTHTPSLTGSDEGTRPSNESKCPFPWQLQILDGQNKEIHHCFCNNWLFLPDYSWPKMATTAKSCLGKLHTATDMGIHLHIKISTSFRKVMTVQPWFVCIMLMVAKGEKGQCSTLSALLLCFTNSNYTFSYSISLFHTWTCVIRSKVIFFLFRAYEFPSIKYWSLSVYVYMKNLQLLLGFYFL